MVIPTIRARPRAGAKGEVRKRCREERNEEMAFNISEYDRGDSNRTLKEGKAERREGKPMESGIPGGQEKFVFQEGGSGQPLNAAEILTRVEAETCPLNLVASH